jgi:hypothetical protein
MKVDEYVGRGNEKLTAQEWEEHRKDSKYVNVREYANKKFHIKAIWHGRLEFFAKNPAEVKRRWLPFRLTILENREDGIKVREKGSGDFATESALVNAYEDFLVRHNLGYWAPSNAEPGSYHFVEVGNLCRRTTKDSPALMGENAMEEAGSW